MLSLKHRFSEFLGIDLHSFIYLKVMLLPRLQSQ